MPATSLPMTENRSPRTVLVLLALALLAGASAGCDTDIAGTTACASGGCADLVFHRISEQAVDGWPSGSDEIGRPIYLETVLTIPAADVAQVIVDPADTYLQPSVHITLSAAAGMRVRKSTAGLIGERIGISVDGRILISPVLRDVIANRIQISGIGTLEEALILKHRLSGGE